MSKLVYVSNCLKLILLWYLDSYHEKACYAREQKVEMLRTMQSKQR